MTTATKLFTQYSVYFNECSVETRPETFFIRISCFSFFGGGGGYASINWTGYHPPGTPGLLHRNVCPAPGLLHNRKCPGGGPINDDVPGVGHLHQLAFKHENC